MKYKEWLDVWFANYIEPSSKTKTCERYSEIIEKHLKVKLGEYELEELSPIVIQKYITELIENGGILQNLYADFISDEYASVNTGEDAIYFIRNYCEKYHSFAMNEYLDKANTVYFGTDEENTAYYYFKDSLSVDNLNRIKEQTDEYIVAAPVLYMSQESLEDKNITFLKVDRDVDEAELKVDDEIAKFAMRATYNKKLPLEATMISRNCGSDIEKGISSHFDGMHLCNNFRTTALCR